jgi:hypothetical protein
MAGKRILPILIDIPVQLLREEYIIASETQVALHELLTIISENLAAKGHADWELKIDSSA